MNFGVIINTTKVTGYFTGYKKKVKKNKEE